MRALAIVALGQPLREVAVEIRPPGRGEVTVAIRAAGVCHSDAHYRAGSRPVPGLPLVPGHEIAGEVVAAGEGVGLGVGDRVALHYLIACETCQGCLSVGEPFCESGGMLGFDRQGGYADQIVVPERNALPIPPEVPWEVAAILMCSTSTVLHALTRAGMSRGETVVVIGAGGLGLSAVQVAAALGAGAVMAVEPDAGRRRMAAGFGADTLHPSQVARISGVADIALDLVGLPETLRSALDVLRPGGRAVVVGIGTAPVELHPFRDLVLRDVTLMGSSDHLRGEAESVLALQASGAIDIGGVITDSIPLHSDRVNQALDRLDRYGPGGRTVIVGSV